MESPGPLRPAPPVGRHLARLTLLLAGVALIVWMFRTVGWPAIEANLRAIGGWFLLLVAIYALPQAAFFLGWWAVMDPRPPLARLPGLFAFYLAGDSANYLAPGGVAGEPLKVHLLSGQMEPGRALASVTLHKHADMLAQWLFVLCGVGVTLASFPLSPRARLGALAGVAVLGAMLAALTWALRRGTYGPALAWLSRWKTLGARLARHQEGARRVDDHIRRFYGESRGGFAAGVALCFLGWCGGAVETWIVLRLLAPERGWAAAFGIETLSMVLTTMLLFIPARVGAAEGARAGVCVLLGLTAAQGVAYGLVRRARELLWVLPGLGVMLARSWRGRAGRQEAGVAGLAKGEIRP
ncbi:MAG: lysylphosphatidylglycerol synthase domain-containing protein [Thermoanaerobaculia bacterium]